MDPSDVTLATLATAHKRHISDATTRHSCQEGVLVCFVDHQTFQSFRRTCNFPTSGICSGFASVAPRNYCCACDRSCKIWHIDGGKRGKTIWTREFEKGLSLHSPTLDYNKLNCLRIKLWKIQRLEGSESQRASSSNFPAPLSALAQHLAQQLRVAGALKAWNHLESGIQIAWDRCKSKRNHLWLLISRFAVLIVTT